MRLTQYRLGPLFDGLGFGGFVDPPRGRQGENDRIAAAASRRVLRAGSRQDRGAVFRFGCGQAVVDIGGRVQPDAGMTVGVVVTIDEVSDEGAGHCRDGSHRGRSVRAKDRVSVKDLLMQNCQACPDT